MTGPVPPSPTVHECSADFTAPTGVMTAAVPLLVVILLLASSVGSTLGLFLGTVVPFKYVYVLFTVARTPLMFTGANAGKAEAAIDFYVSVFGNSRKGNVMHYGPGQEPESPDSLAHANFLLDNLWFAAMDSAREHNFNFNEAFSLMVNCDDQREVDYYWQKLSAVPAAEQCGWLKDKYGVSWQVVPTAMEEMMRNGTEEQIARVTQAFLPMKKFDLAALKRAYEGK